MAAPILYDVRHIMAVIFASQAISQATMLAQLYGIAMPEFVITPPATPSVAVAGSSARFPVRRVFCVGRNYAAHAREMGADPSREPPFSS
jgi:2-keto-4-pentenoate hydratase/2-oxohepta-3-ene-1,7-dioic acid hydratase in catechol pathway